MPFKGYKQSPEHIDKYVAVMNGRLPWNKGKKTGTNHKHRLALLGRKATKETRLKMSVSGKKYRESHRNPKWKGGRDRFFRQQALLRDNYTCQVCGLRDEEIMQVDHIQAKSIFPNLRYVMENLICLCPNCHVRKHKRDRKQVMDKQMNLF